LRDGSQALLAALLFTGFTVMAGDGGETLCLYDVSRSRMSTLAKEMPRFKKQRLILVGERHTEKSHHQIQRHIIKTLDKAGIPLAVGLEMFRADSQKTLDLWVGGKKTISEFQAVYDDNWGFPWSLYSDIFEYARQRRIPLVGLNVSREITRKVAREGFDALSREERGSLGHVACDVDPPYMDFIKRAYGVHAHGQLNFTYFCEAQLVWDTVMALHALQYLKANPGVSMVLLAGSGHAWKKGIPEQIKRRSPIPYVVVLPRAEGSVERETITVDDADYMGLDLQQGGCEKR
jgi:uncharacterized iron-regulated protein